ncbi:MAG: AMP-binding protein, partial [Dinghuibacter sp.]|nr:AMP-binding protein [Dinghuibacter sp.]
MNKHLLHELVSEKARLYPERAAVTDTKRTLSYHELEQNSAALSAILLNMGLEQQQPVALYLPPSA